MDRTLEEFESILKREDDLLNKLTDKQVDLRAAITERNWEVLIDVVNAINMISDAFTEIDEQRDEIQRSLTAAEMKEYLPTIRTLRSKLLKCKIENKVLGDYVNVARQFLQDVLDEALPVKGNKNYSRNGTMTQPQLQSVLVDLRG